MKFERFEDIIAWQKAQDLALDIYDIFDQLKDFGFKDQIRRAVVSISNNIAEGNDRETDKEFKRFLFFAKGSCGEVKSMLYLGKRFSYISNDQFDVLVGRCEEIARIIRGLIKFLS